MKYLSIDIEATGLNEDDLIIEFAAIPFDSQAGTLEESLALHTYIKCPSFESLRSRLDPWVIEHNEKLIRKSHSQGIAISQFKEELENFLEHPNVRKYFFGENFNPKRDKIILFGKSLNAIDLPFLNRDLGWDFMRTHFHHRVLDLSSVAYAYVDELRLPENCRSGSGLMNYLVMGEVCHTALEDAKNTAIMYIKLLQRFQMEHKRLVANQRESE